MTSASGGYVINYVRFLFWKIWQNVPYLWWWIHSILPIKTPLPYKMLTTNWSVCGYIFYDNKLWFWSTFTDFGWSIQKSLNTTDIDFVKLKVGCELILYVKNFWFASHMCVLHDSDMLYLGWLWYWQSWSNRFQNILYKI